MCIFQEKNGGSIGKHLDLNWLAVQSGIWVPLAFVQAEHDGVSLDNFPPACFEYQMESFSWWAGTVPNFAGAFSPDFCCFCNYLDRIIWACSRLAQGKCWATQHESTLPLFPCQHNSVVNVKQQAIRTCLTVIHRFSKGQKGISCHLNLQNDTDPSAKSFQALKNHSHHFLAGFFLQCIPVCMTTELLEASYSVKHPLIGWKWGLIQQLMCCFEVAQSIKCLAVYI